MENFVNNQEKIIPTEKECEQESSVKIYLFRHGKKDGELLSTQGKSDAREMGLKLGANKEMALAAGSFADRTLESSLRVMMPAEFEDEESFFEVESKINKELKVGKKFYRDARLGFETNGPVFNDALEAFNNGNYMEWLYSESDRIAVEKKDTTFSTYSRQAANIAEIIKKYIKLSDNFNNLVVKKEEYQRNGRNKLERYLGSHQSVPESFILEILKRAGNEKVAKSLASDMKNGWGELKSLSVEIKNKGKKKIIIISYPTLEGLKEIEIKPEIIDEIIVARQEFEKLFRE